MDLNDIAANTNTMKGLKVIRLGFSLNKSPIKLPERRWPPKPF